MQQIGLTPWFLSAEPTVLSPVQLARRLDELIRSALWIKSVTVVVIGFFLVVDVAFFAANAVKIPRVVGSRR